MFEVKVPIDFVEQDGGGWQRGLGDVAFAVKHALYHDLGSGSIFSVAGEVVFPTGKEDQGLGKGVTIFEPFVAFGQILSSDGFIQAQVGMELPTTAPSPRTKPLQVHSRQELPGAGAHGRPWSNPGARELVSGE
jgi:hypothetical protein